MRVWNLYNRSPLLVSARIRTGKPMCGHDPTRNAAIAMMSIRSFRSHRKHGDYGWHCAGVLQGQRR